MPGRILSIFVSASKARVRSEHESRRLPGKPLMSCRVTQLYDTGVAVYFYFAYFFEGVPNPAKVYAEIEEAAREEILMAERFALSSSRSRKVKAKISGKCMVRRGIEMES